MSADFEAMFLQVKAPLADAKCLRFIWREKLSDDLSTYEYIRHIFGANDSPTCASYASQRTAKDNEDKCPDVSKMGERNLHMDDLIYSAESIQEAETLMQNLITLLRRGGFNLSQWQSNVKELCEKDKDVESVTAFCL